MELPVQDYYRHALSMKDSEIKLRDQINQWLPSVIIDAHAHCNLPKHVLGVGEYAKNHMLSTFPYLSLKESIALKELFFPGKEVSTLRFAKTFKGIDHRAANDYLLAESPVNDRIALFGLPEDVDYTNRMLKHPRVSALKMYWSYVDPPAKVIYEFIQKDILEEAQMLNVPVILHLPRMIVHSIDDLLQVVSDFPKLRIVVPHIGSSKMVVGGLSEAMNRLVSVETVYMDTSLNPSAEVVGLALDSIGPSRLMFGTDEPLCLIRSAPYEHPIKGQRITADYKYHWIDADEFEEYGHLAKDVPHSHWQSVGAIKAAIETRPRSSQESVKQKIFYETAKTFYNF